MLLLLPTKLNKLAMQWQGPFDILKKRGPFDLKKRGSRGRTGRAGEGGRILARDKGEIRIEEGKEICAGATLIATHAYTRNPESPLGKEIDLQQWDSYSRENTQRTNTGG